MTKVELTSGMW